MIKLVRSAPPSFLNSPDILQAKSHIERSYNSSSQERLKFDMSFLYPIRKELEELSQHKCAYCESRIGVNTTGGIDHFRPKSGSTGLKGEYAPDHYFWLVYDWDNLMPACYLCTRSKRNQFPLKAGSKRVPVLATGEALLAEQALLIDPFREEPAEFLNFLANGKVEAIGERGQTTIEIFDLNRSALVNMRKLAAKNFNQELQNYANLPKANQKALHDKVERIFSDQVTEEFAAVLRTVFTTWNKPHDWPDKLTREPLYLKAEIKLPEKGFFSKLTDVISAGVSDLLDSEKGKFASGFTLRSIEIQNFRAIGHLQLDILPSDSLHERESWLLLLGDNGIGKSSILQAVAMTLCGPERFKSLAINAEDIYKEGAKTEGYVKVYIYERELPFELRFDKHSFLNKPESAPTILLAYGATRLLPKGNLRASKAKANKINISNLFDYSVALVDARQWLLDQSVDDFETRIAPVLIDLLDIKGITKLSRNEEHVFVGERKLGEISDGYKSMIAMACDIMRTLSVEKTRFHETQGVVLIDELGNHLHPRWRMKIAGALRLAFPKLQFLVSTHEPLCLRGLLHGEVIVLVSNKQGEVIALDKSVLPDHNLLKVDQLLTSDLFGLIDTADPQTEEKFDKYYALLLKAENERTAADLAEIERYTRELSDNEIIGSTPQTQAMYQLVNETFAKSLIQDGFKTKEELKSQTVNEVQQLIKDKKIDWL